MKAEKYIIWSNCLPDYDDWKDDMEEQYPDLSEDERISLIYGINNDYLGDERRNLDIQLDRPILAIGRHGAGMAAAADTRRSRAATSGTACMSIRITTPGTWISWGLCGATPSTTMAHQPLPLPGL